MAEIHSNCKVLSTGNYIITQDYKAHSEKVDRQLVKGAFAKGIDLVPVDEKGNYKVSDVVANCDGTVIFAGVGSGYGNSVWIDHGNGLILGYAHMASLKVSKGQKVKANQSLGVCGSTGTSSGVHLHFEIRKMVKSYIIPSPSDFWNPNGFNAKDKFEWVDPTQYVTKCIVEKKEEVKPSPAPSNNYENNTIPERFKVQANGIQIDSYTDYKKACKRADGAHGIVIDSTTGKQIYPVITPTKTEDYTKSTIPNRFRVMKNGQQVNAYKSYTLAVSYADSVGGHVHDSCNGMVQIY